LHVLEIPKLKTQDFFFAVRHFLPVRLPILKDILLITVDDESIDKIKERWPFRRRIYADLLRKLQAGNPRLVALDFVFAGKGEPLDDFLLSEAIEQAGNVVLASFVDEGGNYVLALKDLRKAAKDSGVVNKLLDKDFFVRRTHLFYRDQHGKIVAWPWEIAILRELLGLDKKQFELAEQGLRLKTIGGRDPFFFIPFYDHKEAAINYRFNPEDIERLPLWKALEAKDLAERVRDKIVLAGATSRVLHDYYQTPLGVMPGVLVNLNWLVNILTKEFLKKIPLPLSAVFLTLFTFLSAYLGLRYDVMRGIAVLSLATLGLWGIFFFLFCYNYLGDFFTPFFGGWLVFLAVTFYRYFHTFIENVKLRSEVVTDPLTGLYNRRFLESRIDAEFAKLASEKRSRKTDPFHELSVLMIDIDNFKRINDTYGHQFGDDVLKTVSFSVRESTRKDDVVARFGGEEFCVVLMHISKEEAVQIAEKIRKSVEAKKFNYVNQITCFTVSIGVAATREDGLLSTRAIIRAADLALYEAKRAGKNQVYVYSNKT